MKKRLCLLCACLFGFAVLSPAFAEVKYKDEYKLSVNIS